MSNWNLLLGGTEYSEKSLLWQIRVSDRAAIGALLWAVKSNPLVQEIMKTLEEEGWVVDCDAITSLRGGDHLDKYGKMEVALLQHQIGNERSLIQCSMVWDRDGVVYGLSCLETISGYTLRQLPLQIDSWALSGLHTHMEWKILNNDWTDDLNQMCENSTLLKDQAWYTKHRKTMN
jgi:hypothetical protein